MTNSFYNPSGSPGTGSQGSSLVMRTEFGLVASGFALLPTLSGNGSRAVIINSGGTAMTVTTGTLALAGNFATTGAFNTTLIQVATTSLTLPAVDGTLATLAGTETLSNKTLVAPALGTPASGVLTNCTGTAAGLTAGNVTTNANLSGVITSVGNTTSITSQTGTGSKFVVDTGPTLVTPNIGAATGISLSVSGQLTSTVATGTSPLVVTSTTNVANLNASSLSGATFAAPGPIGSGTSSTGVFTTLSGTTSVSGPNSITISATAAIGIFGNNTDMALRGYSGGNIYFQDASGANTYGRFQQSDKLLYLTSGLNIAAGGAAITGNSIVTGTFHVTSTSALDGVVTTGAGITSSSGSLTLSGSNTVVAASAAGTSYFNLVNSSAGTDLKNWIATNASSNYNISAYNDGISAATTAYTIARGTTINVASHTFYTSTVAGTPLTSFTIATGAAAAVNSIQVQAGSTGNAATLQAIGETNAPLAFSSMGTGRIQLYGGNFGAIIAQFIPVASATRNFTFTNSNGGNATIDVTAGNLGVTPALIGASYLHALAATATPAGGAAANGVFMGSGGLGIYFGSGVPTVSAAKGALYLRSDGSGINDRMYVNTNGTTTWTAVVTAA